MGRPTVRFIAAIAICASIFGCASPKRFDSVSRAASFDSLWHALVDCYAYLEVDDDWLAMRGKYRDAVIRSQTRMAYLSSLATMLSDLDDPHVIFNRLPEYAKRVDGAEWTCVAKEAFLFGGRVWARFDDAAIDRSTATAPATQPSDFCEVVAIGQITSPGLILQMLGGEPGHKLNATTVDIHGVEHVVSLICPPSKPTTSAPVVSQPSQEPSSPKFVRYTMNPSGIGYIIITTFGDSRVVEQFDTALDCLKDCRALVLDVRQNGGGTAEVRDKVLGRFVKGSRPCGYFTYRRRGLLIGMTFSSWYKPLWRVSERGTTYHRPLVVLTDSATGSAAEMFAFALQDVRNATLIGQRTRGAAATIAYITLPDSLELQYSAYPIHRLDGRSIEGVGVAPDIEVPYSRQGMLTDPNVEIRRWNMQILNVAVTKADSLASSYMSH